MKIVSVNVEPGAAVEQHTRLVVLDAIKMEHRIEAPVAGMIKDVRVKPGDLVAAAATLVAGAPIAASSEHFSPRCRLRYGEAGFGQHHATERRQHDGIRAGGQKRRLERQFITPLNCSLYYRHCSVFNIGSCMSRRPNAARDAADLIRSLRSLGGPRL